ncbi:methyltransferase [Leptolyngbya sp. AN03gr2]|uniref:methyltransferase n=1 Tax=unclassified Leptolyngbya TaxID=2650499 RepID=UPI003D321591
MALAKSTHSPAKSNQRKPKQKLPPAVLIRTMTRVTDSLGMLRSKLVPPQATMLQLITGYRISQGIYVVAKLGIADLLATGPKTSQELAALTSVHAPSLYRVMRSLASLGIFTEQENGRFELTPLAATLKSDHPNSVHDAAVMFVEDWHWQVWGNFFDCVKTGKTALEQTFDTSNLFDYFATRNPEAGHQFDRAMTNTSVMANQALPIAYDFGAFQTLVDVGGGQGSFLVALLQEWDHLSGILFDLPSVIESTRQQDLLHGFENRTTLVAGDFFESVPEGADAYLLKTIIHDWDDVNAIAILKSCRRAMSRNSKLLLVELVVPPGNTPSLSKMLDLEMLAVFGGVERTEAEYRSLLSNAGFQLTRIYGTSCPWSVIEAIPV